MIKLLSTLSFLLLSAVGVHATNPGNDSIKTVPDSVVTEVRPSFYYHLDSLVNTVFFEQSASRRNSMDTAFPEIDSIPVFADSIVKQRLEQLNKQTPFNVVYNSKTKAFIKMYTVKRRQQVAAMLGLAEFYFPLFEEILDKYDMPQELKYLAVVESALNPRARSRAGAVGLWQFMYSTGKLYGLEQNSYMDERMDPVKSTEAACKYLSYLYGIYGKWDLALAAYNCGPGNVNKAIRRSGKGLGNYWDVYPFLPRETRGYVPAFIAAYYTFEHADLYNIPAIQPLAFYFETDTVHVSAPVHYEELSLHYGLSPEVLAFLNPAYKRDRVPAYSNKTSVLRLPKKYGSDHKNELDSLAAITAKKEGKENDGNLSKFAEDRVYYTVRSGDVLGRISGRYGVTSRQIMAWNNMRSTRINIGQKLVIYPKGGTGYQAQKKPKKEITTSQAGDYVYYKIQSGDTLWDIAKARGVSVDELKKLNADLNTSRLKPGTKIIVGTNG